VLQRKDILIPLIKGKSVLHVGAAGTDLDSAMIKSDRWLHGILAAHARSVLALDINEEACRLMMDNGYAAVCANAEEFSRGETFDVIVAAEILEHLSNPGRALNCFRRHLKADGRLFVSVPNVNCFTNQLRKQLLGRELVHPQHVCWYSETTLLCLLRRHGFTVERHHYCPMFPPKGENWKTYLKRLPLMVRPSWRESIVSICSVSQ